MTDARKTKKELEAELDKLRRRVKILETLDRRGKQAEKMFHSAFENAPVAMCLLSPQGRFLSVNAAFCRMLGYSKDELLSMGFAEVTHPDDLSASKDWVDKLLAGVETTMDLDKRYIGKTGQVVWGIVRAFLLRDGDGNPLFFITHIQDITERKRAEQAILAERDFSDAALNSLPGMFYLFDQTGRLLRWNRNLERVSEFSSEEISGMSPLDFFVGSDKTLIEERIREVFSKGASYAEANLVSKSGKQTPYYFTGQTIHVEGSTCLIGTGTDVTERKRVERQIADTLAFIQKMIESSPVGIITYNANGDTVWTNEATARIIGGTMEQTKAQNFRRIETWKRSGLLNAAETALATGTEQQLDTHVTTTFGKEIWLSSRFIPYVFEGQQHLLGMYSDITERVQMEEALFYSEKQFRNLLENVQLVAVMLDRNGNITYCNSYLLGLTGWSTEEILGKSWFDLFLPEETRENVRSIFKTGIAQGLLPIKHENDIVARNGARRLIVWNNSVLYDRHGDVTGVASIGIDVTEHRSLEEQLRQSQKMDAVGRLAGGIAHDFNNLLTVIIGYGELLLSKIEKDNPLNLEAGEIRKAALKAASLTSQLLAFSRRQILSPKVLDLNSIVTDVENMLHRLIEEHINLALNLCEDLWKVKADRSRIEQVIVNLAINAKDAMPKGGTLTIETRNIQIDDMAAKISPDIGPGAYAVLSIKDTGHGMDRETMARIFEPFFTTKGVGKGTGLGLATVYGIVAQSGGHIHVDSEPGHGTTFSIYLPRAQEAPSAPKEAAPAEMNTVPAGTKTILLVEDSDIVRKLTHDILEINGYAVLEASSPEDAIRLCESHEGEIHLLLTDVVMPGMSGRDLSGRLQPVRPGMKVLYMSGYTNDAIVVHGILNDGIHFIQKPFSPASMAQKILEVLNSD
jgi:two-component system, cell cycle sensor histidine kinase and response regulator CckA